jgi:hypothetical protein
MCVVGLLNKQKHYNYENTKISDYQYVRLIID